MGIRGLTTFINSNCRQYLEEYHLRDTYLVLDGYNIALHLYTWHCKRNDCFGGDYDKYAKVVYDFFKMLKACNVTPILIFDGGFENKKLRTIYSRLKSRIQTAKHLNSVTQGGLTMFPLFLRDLFVDIVLALGLKAMKCDFEADYEMACVAKSLNCPVLSYDSDFYIFDVLYIPFSTFEMCPRKTKNSSAPSYFIMCQIYKIEKFLNSVGGLSKENLPLLSTLLGNDYIKMSVFQHFYSQLKLPKTRQGQTGQQAKILGTIKWLLNESYDSAVLKILGRLKSADRQNVAEQIKISTETYLNYNSEVLQYLNLNVLPVKSSVTFKFDATKYLETAECVEDEVEENNDTESVSDETEHNMVESNVEIPSKINNNIPDWFKEKFRRCEFPQSFMDILCHNIYICTPQIEDYANICSHNISLKIISAIQKILLWETSKNLTCAVRTDFGTKINNLKVPLCPKTLPKLSDVILLVPIEAKAILLDILDITASETFNELIDILPNSWQLYFIAIIYWIKNVTPKVTSSYVCSLIICIFVLNKVDPQVGFYRSTYKFTSQFSQLIRSLPNNPKSTCNTDLGFKESLNSISYEESLHTSKELIEYFQMYEKMRSYGKLFDIRILDCFAQFQSCLIHIKYLNRLLNKPFCNFMISEFYDGTFLFNMCLNLNKRTDINAYLSQTLLKNSPNIFNCLRQVLELLFKVVPNNVSVNNNRRRRRKKKIICSSSKDCSEMKQSSEDEGHVDINNRFYVLRLTQ